MAKLTSHMKKWQRRNHNTANDRQYDDPLYVDWRKQVRRRDRNSCQFPDCKEKTKAHDVQVHHIRPWKIFPALRYDILNGICLCRKCHKMITGNESIYETILLDIAIRRTIEWKKLQ